MNKKQSGLIKHPCPNCQQMVYWSYGMPGREHCEYCATDEQVSTSKSLKELNEERARELGKLGGLATKKKYGKAHYQKLAQNMNKKLGRGTGDNPENTKG